MTIRFDHRPRWLAAAGASLLAHLILIACAIGWVAIYSHLIAPNQPIATYHAHAQASGPYVSTFVGMPVFIVLAYWIGRRHNARAIATAMAFAMFYLVVDAAILFAASSSPMPWGLVALSYISKIGAALMGGWLAANRQAAIT